MDAARAGAELDVPHRNKRGQQAGWLEALIAASEKSAMSGSSDRRMHDNSRRLGSVPVIGFDLDFDVGSDSIFAAPAYKDGDDDDVARLVGGRRSSKADCVSAAADDEDSAQDDDGDGAQGSGAGIGSETPWGGAQAMQQRLRLRLLSLLFAAMEPARPQDQLVRVMALQSECDSWCDARNRAIRRLLGRSRSRSRSLSRSRLASCLRALR